MESREVESYFYMMKPTDVVVTVVQFVRREGQSDDVGAFVRREIITMTGKGFWEIRRVQNVARLTRSLIWKLR